MNLIRRRILSLALLVGLIGTATAPASAVSLDGAPVEASVSAEVLQKGPWEVHEKNFKSKATCEARRAVFMQQYAGYWIGGVAESKCASYSVPQCPKPITKYQIWARTWFSQNGPRSVTPLVRIAESPNAEVAAC